LLHPLFSEVMMNLPNLSKAIIVLPCFLLAACNSQNDSRTVGQKIDATIEQTKDTARDAAQSAQQSAQNVEEVIDDTAITASVSASLAADSQLSAINIDVNTNAGHVQLTGPAPSLQAKNKATLIAQNVKGVVSVDNKLVVAGS
jgi:hyperosmotically inducible periplasmic protein